MNIQRDLPVTHIVIGTKAQFIKMAPIARLLQESGWPYRLLDLGQHGSITPGIVSDFGLEADHLHVLPPGATVTTYSQALHWVLAAISRIASPRRALSAELVKQPAGYALVHGDTLSTILGLHLARRLRLRLGLVEAGLSSGKLFDPFPEELIRRHVEKRANMLFAPDDVSAERLRARSLKGEVVSTEYNTGRDALLLIAAKNGRNADRQQTFSTVLTLHRAETISRSSRLREIIGHVIRLAPEIGRIRFFLHEPTRRALIRANLLEPLTDNSHFELVPLGSYPEFTKALARSRYILTDGGSIQEEASYLNKPCLILRRTTERQQGIGTTAMLTSFDVETDLEFLHAKAHDGSISAALTPSLRAARIIVEHLYPRAFPVAGD
ncbi:MAG TPA: UDP-N-acetylglucosamine 2-epimerase [Gammaproteobacteria bacterium]|nr:UDP-N-acetylglucosamine 2-epimerase [Gammaproteobacteria bacterium]